MKLYDPISEDSILHRMDRKCGSTANTQSLRAKLARVNSALDRYLHLAFKADGRHSFDDINHATAPIDTQNIVSGTNSYKFSDFSEKILYLMKLTILNSSAVESKLIPENFNNLNDSFLQIYDTDITGVPYRYTKYGDFIYLRPTPNYSEASGLRVYFNRPASKFDFDTFTVTIAAPGVFTLAAHGFAINDTVMLETDGALPTGLAVDTVYYVVATVATNTFSVSATKGGTAITTSGSQSGVHYLTEMSKVPGIPENHHSWLADYASWDFLDDYPDLASKADRIFRKVQIGEAEIIDFFANRNKDEKSIMTMKRTFNGR